MYYFLNVGVKGLKRKCVSDVVRIGSIIIFHLSELSKAKFCILCEAVGEILNWSLLGMKQG